MDLRLTLLLIVLCNRGATNAEVEDVTNPPMPLVPLLPARPAERAENESTSQVEIDLLPTTASRISGASSEEEQEDGCARDARSARAAETVAAHVQRLGLQLLQNLEATQEQPNIIVSPLSISLALSQLALGAANETEELLVRHLHGNTLACYHQSLRHILGQLKNEHLQIATRIFLAQGFEPKQDFIRESRRMYDSEPAVLESLQQVNDWVEKATGGKMTNFLSNLPADVLLMLINAVHFKGKWKTQFDPRFTSKGVFYLDDNHMVDVEVMEDAKYPLSLFIDNDLEAQVARFPFQNSMSLLVVMPVSGQMNMSSLASKLNISGLYGRLPPERAVQVKVPKFKLEYCQELEDALGKLGLGEMFASPDLSGVADGALLVSGVLHKSVMELNEEGAEAVATTSLVISRASNPGFHLNQPFFFAIMDDVTRVPIFMGVVNNPDPGAPVTEKGEFGNKDKTGLSFDKNHARPFGGPPK